MGQKTTVEQINKKYYTLNTSDQMYKTLYILHRVD